MNPIELYRAIENIGNAKIDDIKSRLTASNISMLYLVVYADGKAITTNNISFLYTGGYEYAFVIVTFGAYSSNFYKTFYELATIITEKDIVMDIIGEHWKIRSVWFGFTPYGYMAPIIKIALNSNENDIIEYYVNGVDKFKETWQFFKELNLNSTSLESGEIYKKYYLERLNTQHQDITLIQYKTDLEKKESIITQYKSLLDLIDKKLTF